MFGMAITTAKLFFAGKLFKDNRKVVSQFALGAGLGIVCGVAVGLVAPLWVATITAGVVAGAVQPALLKHVKYA